MADIKETSDSSGVDKSLVAMFLKMTPDERVKANDNMVRTIEELRNALDRQRLPVLEETLRQMERAGE